jgi:hypothetical protein
VLISSRSSPLLCSNAPTFPILLSRSCSASLYCLL